MTQTHADHYSARSANGAPAQPANVPVPTEPPRRRTLRTRFGAVSSETLRVLPLLVPVLLAGAAATAAAAYTLIASEPSARTLLGLAALLVASAIAEALPVPIEGVAVGRTSFATIFIVAAAVIYGWDAATLIGVASMAAVEVGRRKPFTRIAYNTAVYALAGIAAGEAAEALEGSSLARIALATAVASSAFYLTNITLLSAVVARSARETWLSFLGYYLYWTAAPFGVMACLTAILVVVWDRSPVAAFLLAGPLASIVLYERRMHAAFRRLRELDRLKDEFIAVVSHELRTPLASVYGAAMTLQRQSLDKKSQESMLGIVYRESARLARLVDQVLWASRLESGRAEVAIHAFDAVELVRDVVDAARAHLPPGLWIDMAHAPAVPPASGDSEKVKQVLVNLVENAVKYSPDGGRIEVSVVSADGHVVFTVEDEGLGIPVAEQRRIFEKFHRLDPNLTRGVGGTGLGLYICRELLRRMGGRIWVTSDVGKGSAFTFELPRADAAS